MNPYREKNLIQKRYQILLSVVILVRHRMLQINSIFTDP